MGDMFYNSYKRRFIAADKKRTRLFAGKLYVVIGILLLVWALISIPYHAEFVSEVSGDAMQDGKVYYMESLQILDAKVDDDDQAIYCVGKFQDKNEKEWIISFNPGNDELVEKQILLATSLGTKIDVKTSGYVYVDDNLGDAGTFYSIYSKNYADADEGNILKLQADYLCDISGNFTVATILYPGYIRGAFFIGIAGLLYGGFLLLKYRTPK